MIIKQVHKPLVHCSHCGYSVENLPLVDVVVTYAPCLCDAVESEGDHFTEIWWHKLCFVSSQVETVRLVGHAGIGNKIKLEDTEKPP